MVRYQRSRQLKKGEHENIGEDEETQALVFLFANSGYSKRTRPKLFTLLFLSILSCGLVLAPHLFGSSSSLSLLCKLLSLSWVILCFASLSVFLRFFFLLLFLFLGMILFGLVSVLLIFCGSCRFLWQRK